MGGGGSIGGFVEDASGHNVSTDSTMDRSVRGQQDAARRASALQKDMFDEMRSDLSPYRQAGAKAVGDMGGADYMRDFGMGDFQADPGYQFRLAEAEKAINRGAAARGMGNSGATLKALTGHSQNMASEEYNNAYNRFNMDRDRRFGRLSSLAGLGQNAAAQTGNAGQNYAGAVGENYMGGANAQAAGNMAQLQQRENGKKMMASMATMFSDARLKTDVEPIPREELEEFRVNIRPILFKYISDVHGAGQWAGVFAQDLEKSRLGRTLVETDENGDKKINLTKAYSLMLATMGEA